MRAIRNISRIISKVFSGMGKSYLRDVAFSTILLQLTSPIKGTDSGIIHSIIQTAVLPPVILTVMVILCYIFFKRVLYILKIFSQKKIPRWSKIIIELCVASNSFAIQSMCREAKRYVGILKKFKRSVYIL